MENTNDTKVESAPAIPVTQIVAPNTGFQQTSIRMPRFGQQKKKSTDPFNN
jgi:hypothetical protein